MVPKLWLESHSQFSQSKKPCASRAPAYDDSVAKKLSSTLQVYASASPSRQQLKREPDSPDAENFHAGKIRSNIKLYTPKRGGNVTPN